MMMHGLTNFKLILFFLLCFEKKTNITLGSKVNFNTAGYWNRKRIKSIFRNSH